MSTRYGSISSGGLRDEGIVCVFEPVPPPQGILDQFNPSLKNFVAMGKHYEKALTGQSEGGNRFSE